MCAPRTPPIGSTSTVRADDTLAVFLRASDPSAGPAYFERVYHPDDTEEVRIYTGAGDDRVTVDTAGGTSIAVRLVCGAGENIVELNAGASTLRCGLAPVGSSGPGREVADRIWLSPGEPIEEIGTPFRSQGLPLKSRRDWGSTRYGQPWFAVGPGIGLFGGFGLTWETFDFRKRPYGKQQRVRAGFATGALRPRFDYSGIFRRENRESHIEVHALASGIETLNFFGVGNETPSQSNETFRRSKRVAAEVEVRSVWSIGSNAVVYTGPVVRYSSTEDADDDPRLINLLRPYGVDDMGQVGWGVGLHFNNRRPASLFEPKDSDDIMRVREALVGRGQTADIDARYYPDVWDLEGDYAVVRGEVSSSHWAGGSGPGFGVGVGGQVTEGDVPYYDLAYLGAQQVRGLARGRFAGDSSLFVNARFAIPVGRLNLVVPGHWGLFAGGDTGRVWADGEQSDTWHYGYGWRRLVDSLGLQHGRPRPRRQQRRRLPRLRGVRLRLLAGLMASPRARTARDRYGRALPRGSRDEMPHARDPEEVVSSAAEALAHGVELFNAERFFEAHEFFEYAWKSDEIAPEDRRFLRGVTQVAVGCCHAQRANTRGVTALLRRAMDNLTLHPSSDFGLDTDELIAAARQVLAQVAENGASSALPFPKLRPPLSPATSPSTGS